MPLDPQEELNKFRDQKAPEIVLVDSNRVLTDSEATALSEALRHATENKKTGTEIWSAIKDVLSLAKVFI